MAAEAMGTILFAAKKTPKMTAPAELKKMGSGAFVA